MKKQILQYLEYNVWANQTLIDYLASLPAEQLQQHIMSSFPSIHLTMLHIWDAEIIWQKRLRREPIEGFPSQYFKGNQQDLFDGMMASSKEFINMITPKDAAYFEETMQYMTMSYGETTQSTYDMLHHCMNHSTYHRGQIITMLRQLGHTDLPHLDYMLFKIQGH